MSGRTSKALAGSVALAAAIAISASANAADLGGNCCADLEERIAELEATTARKGNRKVSLTISGWVAEQVVWWDDGVETNAYVTGVGVTLSSHFKLTGQATIAPGWTAGYVIHVETNSADPTAVTQSRDDAGAGVSVLQSYWFINSDRLGKLSVGQQSHASDNTAILVDGSGSLVPANWVLFDGTNFSLRSNGILVTDFTDTVRQTWGGGLGLCQHTGLGIGADCNGLPLNAVRYDSPTIAGFSVSSSWGEDDFVDVAARYAGQFNGVKIAIAAAWSYQSEGAGDLVTGGHNHTYLQIGGYIEHAPTGLFLYGAYGKENNHNDLFQVASTDGSTFGPAPDGSHWYLKAGLRRKFHELGHTVLYGEYGVYSDMYNGDLNDLANGFAAGTGFRSDSRLTRWGLGIVQEIDAAAMSLWLTYRNLDGEISGNDPGGVSVDFDTLHVIKAGALINF